MTGVEGGFEEFSVGAGGVPIGGPTVQINDLPEPGTWLAAGSALLVFALRRLTSRRS
jgi:hypothetical protein